jgi:hypothetical protein
MKLTVPKVILLVLITVCFLQSGASAEEYPLVYSPLMSKQEGAINILTLNKALLYGSNSMNPFFRQNPALRFAKLFLNFELMDFTLIVNHEVYGHGSAAREYGGYANYKIYMKGITWSGYTWYKNVSFDQNGSIYAAASGTEANQVLGFESQKTLYARNKISADDFWLLLPKLDFTIYVLRTCDPHTQLTAFLNCDGDKARIIRRLCEKYYGIGYSTQNLQNAYDQMKNSSYYAIIDPAILTGLYSIFAYTFYDQYEYEVPGFHFNGHKITPGTRVAYNPYGPDAYLDFYIKPIGVKDPHLIIPYIRGGEFAGKTNWGFGVEFYNLKKVIDNIRFDLWRQENDFGLNVEVLNKFKINEQCSFLLDTYYKTAGYLIGKPYLHGVRMFGGIELIL